MNLGGKKRRVNKCSVINLKVRYFTPQNKTFVYTFRYIKISIYRVVNPLVEALESVVQNVRRKDQKSYPILCDFLRTIHF